MKRVIVCVIMLAMMMPVLIACRGGQPPKSADGTQAERYSTLPEYPIIDGSTSTQVMHAAIRAYLVDEYFIEPHSQTYAALERLVPGSDDPADVILAVKYYEETLEDVKARGADLVITPIAKEGFVFIVHPDNPVDNISQQQLRGIYSGEITNWSEIGGKDEEIIPYIRNTDSGSQTAMEDFMHGTPIAEGLEFSPILTMGDMLAEISFQGSPAIGFSIYSWAVEQRVYVDGLKLLAVDGVTSSNETLANDSYPLRVYTYSYYNEGNIPGKNLTEWLLTDEGQMVIASAGYVGIFGELPPDELTDYNRDDTNARQVIDEFYIKHGLISAPDDVAQRADHQILRLTDREQTALFANEHKKSMAALYLFFSNETYDNTKDEYVYELMRFIVLTREIAGEFEVIDEGEVLSFENGIIETSGEDSHIERFPVEIDFFSYSCLGSRPGAFRGYVPDFEAIGIAVGGCKCHNTGILTMKKGTPYLLEIYVAGIIEPDCYWRMCIQTEPDNDMLYDEKLDDLNDITENIVYDTIMNHQSVRFTWDGLYFAMHMYTDDYQVVWMIVQHMQQMNRPPASSQ